MNCDKYHVQQVRESTNTIPLTTSTRQVMPKYILIDRNTQAIHNTGSVPVLGLSKIGQNFENAKTCNFSAKIGHDSENWLIRS